jgi:hypothetical protein
MLFLHKHYLRSDKCWCSSCPDVLTQKNTKIRMSEKIQVLWDVTQFCWGGTVLWTSNPRKVNSCPGNMKALQSFKTSGITHPVTQNYIPQGLNRQCCCQNLILVMSEHFCLMINKVYPAFMRARENIWQILFWYVQQQGMSIPQTLKKISHKKLFQFNKKNLLVNRRKN